MRQTFSDLLATCANGAGQDTSSTSATFFKQRINARYEQVISKLPSFHSQITKTFTTVDDQQYYHYPPQIRSVESLTITIGSVIYPVDTIYSYKEWNNLNSIQFQAGAIPRYFFNRQRDFGIYPIPQGSYTGTITYNLRAGGLTKTDYTTGTVTVAENDATVEGAGGMDWTGGNAAVDEWFSLADSNGESKGAWYRISGVTDADTLELESVFEEASAATQSYIIGMCAELPSEGHDLLAYGALADYFSMFRQSQTKAQGWSNMFWAGDWNNSSRKPMEVQGGLINLIRTYQDRDQGNLVRRKPRKWQYNDKEWATTVS